MATPGRLLDLMNRGVGRFDGLEVLVLDEADRMLDMGFLPDVKRVIAHLPKKQQTMLFSATMPKEVLEFSRQILHDPAMIQIGRQAKPAEGVNQAAFPVAQHLKSDLLRMLLGSAEMECVLIFSRTKVRTERLARQLKESGFKAAQIHGDRTQGQRLAALEGFRDRVYRILVATDIAACGIDIERISHVINYDVPMTPEDYVHRIGRIACIILSIGMAVDSNVLIYERMREEFHAGKPLKAGIDGGYDKAFWTIIDSHVTTLITAVVLFIFGTGPIRGYAVTLKISLVANLFTAVFVSHLLFDLTVKKSAKKLSI